MAKFKIGERVQATRDGHACPVKKDMLGMVVEDDDIPYVLWDEQRSQPRWAMEEDALKHVSNWDNLTVGDILIDEDGDERRILGVCGQVLMISLYNNKQSFDDGYTAHELQEDGWTIKGADSEPTTTELSIAELEEKLDMAPGTLRVKKD